MDGLTYSLSSFKSQTWLLTYTAVTASVALGTGWLISMSRLRAFQAGPRKASEATIGYVFFVIYLLALPILINFAINGVIITWNLPEFYSAYSALLSLIQWILVAVFGLGLVGVAAIIAHFVPESAMIYKKPRRKYEH